MNNMFDVAVVGATGGQSAKRCSRFSKSANFPVGNLYPLASRRSAGSSVRVQGAREYTVGRSRGVRFLPNARIGLFSAGASVSAQPRPAGRGSRLHRCRQQLAVPVRRRRYPARRSRGQPARYRGLHQPKRDHRESELLHHPDGGRPSASSMPTAEDRTHQRGDLPVGVGYGEGRPSRSSRTQTAALLNGQAGRGRGLSEADRVQCAAAHRRLHGQRLHQGRDEDGVGDAQDHGGRLHPGESRRRSGSRCSTDIPRRCTSRRARSWARTRRARFSSERPGWW